MMSPNFIQSAALIGRNGPGGVEMLGTGFIISPDGEIGTTYHIIGSDHNNIVLIHPQVNNAHDYQDISEQTIKYTPCSILEVDPVRDLCILKSDITFPEIV